MYVLLWLLTRYFMWVDDEIVALKRGDQSLRMWVDDEMVALKRGDQSLRE